MNDRCRCRQAGRSGVGRSDYWTQEIIMASGHLEHFGPDFGRGPFAAHRIETAAVQIATALAQLRAPLKRDDEDITDHAQFIRSLADILAPDWAAQIDIDVGIRDNLTIPTSIRTAIGAFSLLECWLADSTGGGRTTTAPASVTWNSGVILQTIADKRHYLIITPHTGALDVSVTDSGPRAWYWAICRGGRVYYSSQLYFN
ncbi:MAG: hypothetical protein ABIG44_07475 [Planctomycetota bacterium]